MSITPAFSVSGSDLEWQYFRTGGNGGQHRDKTSNGARVVHRASQARGECTENRSQLANRRMALRRMTEDPKFKVWVQQQLFYNGETPEQRAEKDMLPANLKVEYQIDGDWSVV